MNRRNYILGISAYYHDSAACLLRDGAVVTAVQEERFTRKKHDASFPENAIAACLNEEGISSSDLQAVVFYDKPLLKFERILETYLAYAPRGLRSFLTAMPAWIKQKLWVKDTIADTLDYKGDILFSEHHLSHAASAFFPSPFQEAAILTMDGVGEWATTSWGTGKDNTIDLLSEVRFPHSLGLLYSAFTYFTGFRVNSGEYKVMGLAPYGKPVYRNLILEELIHVKEDGSFRLNMDYFKYPYGLEMTSAKFVNLFGGPPRKPESPLTQREMDLARSVQEVTEMVVEKMVRHITMATGMRNLCLAGGVALNCVSNGNLLKSGLIDRLWIQPASGDAGGALGAALAAWYLHFSKKRMVPRNNFNPRLGKSYTDDELLHFLDHHGIPYKHHQNIARKGAELIAEQQVVGWYQGRMEFGPRALGNRSILGDARSATMQKTMNLKIKYRESFRPFAPAVLEEECSDWFELQEPSPYMLLVADVRRDRLLDPPDNNASGLDLLKIERSRIPAVTHVDNSARIQTVSREDNALFHGLLQEFHRQTGCPVLVNTSFNVRGEPIVESPGDAYKCFMRTEMDFLILGNYVLDKREQPEFIETLDWRQEYALD